MWKKVGLCLHLLFFFTSGGLPPKCKQFLNRLAELHVVKKKTRYQDVA